jgi:ketopantoate reductase
MVSMPSVVVIGIGQLGAVFANGFLKLGYAVIPVTRSQSVAERLVSAGEPELVLVAVGEAQLPKVLDQIPGAYRERVALVQNELVPRDWLTRGFSEPSGVVVWFEKKAGRAVHMVQQSLSYGPERDLLVRALTALDIDGRAIQDSEIPFELALKNLYILVHNLAGLRTGGSVGALWERHAPFARDVAQDVVHHQQALLGMRLDELLLHERLAQAVAADPEHACAGRSARERLDRVLRQADELGVELNTLPGLVDDHG